MVAPRSLTCWLHIGCTPRTPAPAAASAPPPPPPPPAPQIRTIKSRQEARISGRPPRQRGLPMRKAFCLRPDMHAKHKTSYEKGVPSTGMAADLRRGVGARLTSSGYQTPGWVAPSRTAWANAAVDVPTHLHRPQCTTVRKAHHPPPQQQLRSKRQALSAAWNSPQVGNMTPGLHAARLLKRQSGRWQLVGEMATTIRCTCRREAASLRQSFVGVDGGRPHAIGALEVDLAAPQKRGVRRQWATR
jgi:hypothetical protein